MPVHQYPQCWSQSKHIIGQVLLLSIISAQNYINMMTSFKMADDITRKLRPLWLLRYLNQRQWVNGTHNKSRTDRTKNLINESMPYDVSLLLLFPWECCYRDDIMKTLFAFLALCQGKPPVTTDSLTKRQRRGALIFSLSLVRTSCWRDHLTPTWRHCNVMYNRTLKSNPWTNKRANQWVTDLPTPLL